MNLVWRSPVSEDATLKEAAEHFCAQNLFTSEQEGAAILFGWIEKEEIGKFTAILLKDRRQRTFDCEIRKEGKWYNAYQTSSSKEHLTIK